MDESKKTLLKEAFESEEIKPLYKNWIETSKHADITARYVLKPMLCISLIGILLVGYSGIKSKNKFEELLYTPEAIELRENVSQNEDYKSFMGKLIYGIYDFAEVSGFGVGLGIGALFSSLFACGGAVKRSGKKRGELEKALNDKGLSLDDFSDL